MLTIVEQPKAVVKAVLPPEQEAIVSWNAVAASGSIDVQITTVDGRLSAWLPYVSIGADRRRSLNGRDDVARIETDVVRASLPIHTLAVRSTMPLDAVAITTPPSIAALAIDPGADEDNGRIMLDVPARTQYLTSRPEMRGWCSPASLAMLLAYWGTKRDLESVTRGVHDDAYGGTGNWAFTVAYAATAGLRGVVVHLRSLEHARRFLAAEIPLALSIAWERGALAGAPLEASAGHLLVLRGIDRTHVIVNDPAHPQRTVRYERTEFERCWLPHGGIAYAVAPRERSTQLVALANGAASR